MRSRIEYAFGAAILAFTVACGSDSGTGPNTPATSVSAQDALKSLQAGLASTGGSAMPVVSVLGTGSLGSFAPSQVGQIDATLDGKAVRMFALVNRTTYPTGTCLEQLVSLSGLGTPEPTCTTPPGGLTLVLWETSAASTPPDRMIVVLADLGSTSFSDWTSFASPGTSIPPLALYVERSGAIWMSNAGTLTSAIRATGQTCSLPLPSFVTSATCSFATFTEAGHLSFAPLAFTSTGATGAHSFDLVSGDIPGMIENITGLSKSATGP